MAQTEDMLQARIHHTSHWQKDFRILEKYNSFCSARVYYVHDVEFYWKKAKLLAQLLFRKLRKYRLVSYKKRLCLGIIPK